MENNIEQTKSQTDLEQEKESLLAQRQELAASFIKAVLQKKPGKMSRVFQRLRQINEFLHCLERIDKARCIEKQDTARQYVVSSLFLYECFKALTADRDEQFFFL